MLDKDQLTRIIPHRPPFLWIDRVRELKPGVLCIAEKYIDPQDPLFTGHFPGNALFPGVLIIEAAAQTGAVMLGASPKPNEPDDQKLPGRWVHLLAAVNSFKFLKPVSPGILLRIEAKTVAGNELTALVKAVAWVDNRMVARGELMLLTRRQDIEGTDTGRDNGNAGTDS